MFVVCPQSVASAGGVQDSSGESSGHSSDNDGDSKMLITLPPCEGSGDPLTITATDDQGQ